MINADSILKTILKEELSNHDKLIKIKGLLIEIILYGFSNSKIFKDNNIVFYGGTALNRCILDNTRFSEDLDFNYEMLDISHNEIVQEIKNIRGFLEKNIDFGDNIIWQLFISDATSRPGSVKLNISDNYLTNNINILIKEDNDIGESFGKVKLDIQAYGGIIRPPKEIEEKSINFKYLISKNSIKIKSKIDIIVGKIQAFTNRTKSRDLFDIIEIFKNEGEIKFKKLLISSGVNIEEFTNKLRNFELKRNEMYPILTDNQLKNFNKRFESDILLLVEQISNINVCAEKSIIKNTFNKKSI